ncbi:hypothetical protein, partial [Methylobacterium crusticola]
GMDLSGLQYDTLYPTGQVRIEIKGNKHSFKILSDQAYDYIDEQEALDALPNDAALLYHGSLITRNPVSYAWP